MIAKNLYRFRVEGEASDGVYSAVDEADQSKVFLAEVKPLADRWDEARPAMEKTAEDYKCESFSANGQFYFVAPSQSVGEEIRRVVKARVPGVFEAPKITEQPKTGGTQGPSDASKTGASSQTTGTQTTGTQTTGAGKSSTSGAAVKTVTPGWVQPVLVLLAFGCLIAVIAAFVNQNNADDAKRRASSAESRADNLSYQVNSLQSQVSDLQNQLAETRKKVHPGMPDDMSSDTFKITFHNSYSSSLDIAVLYRSLEHDRQWWKKAWFKVEPGKEWSLDAGSSHVYMYADASDGKCTWDGKAGDPLVSIRNERFDDDMSAAYNSGSSKNVHFRPFNISGSDYNVPLTCSP